MQLSPLQSRLAASLVASCLLIVLYLFFFLPQLATAIELDAITPVYEDHDDDWISEPAPRDVDAVVGALDGADLSYEPDFAAFDRSIIGRAPDGTTGLKNNEPWTSNISPGDTITCIFELSSAPDSDNSGSKRLRELRKRSDGPEMESEGEGSPGNDSTGLNRRQEASRTLYISANTCQQPSRISPDQTTLDPPQLTLFVSKSSDNTSPGPDQENTEFIPFEEGAVMYNMPLTENVFFSIHAPQVSSEHFTTTLPYNFEIAASVDESFHSVNDNPNSELIWIDSDATGALFTTRNLTSSPDQVIDDPPYLLFANNKKDMRINGIRNSYCGLRREAQIRVPENGMSGQITTGLKQGGPGNLTKQEFYVGGLNASSQYVGILVKDPTVSTPDRRRDVAGGGGVVFRQTEMDTKPREYLPLTGRISHYLFFSFTYHVNAEGACRVIFNLTLCDETQYAVPANADLFPDVTDLEAFYDNYTRTMYENFEKSLQQVQCEAPPENRYSLVKSCDDCRQAYKNWLCSVAVPRCEDFSEPDRPYLQARNIDKPFPNNQSRLPEEVRSLHENETAYTSSRNPLIDEVVQPGPYKEVLPCDDVCYQLVQSCPAALGFDCPLRGSIGFDVSYGRRDGEGVTCNYPGSAHYPSASGRAASVPWLGLWAAAAGAACVVSVFAP